MGIFYTFTIYCRLVITRGRIVGEGKGDYCDWDKD